MIYEVHDSGFEGLTTMWQQAAEPCSTRGSESDEIFFFLIYMNRVSSRNTACGTSKWNRKIKKYGERCQEGG